VPFGEQKQAYEDDRGWEAKAGSSRAITVPSDWIGRICASLSLSDTLSRAAS